MKENKNIFDTDIQMESEYCLLDGRDYPLNHSQFQPKDIEKVFKKNIKIKDVKGLCRVWQKQSLDGLYQNYPDLTCIIFNLKYQKYL